MVSVCNDQQHPDYGQWSSLHRYCRRICSHQCYLWPGRSLYHQRHPGEQQQHELPGMAFVTGSGRQPARLDLRVHRQRKHRDRQRMADTAKRRIPLGSESDLFTPGTASFGADLLEHHRQELDRQCKRLCKPYLCGQSKGRYPG